MESEDDSLSDLWTHVRECCGAERPHLSADDWTRGHYGPTLAAQQESIPDVAEEEALVSPPETTFLPSVAWQTLLSVLREPRCDAMVLDSASPDFCEVFRRDCECKGVPCVFLAENYSEVWSLEALEMHYGEEEWRLSDTHGLTMTLRDYMRYVRVQEGGVGQHAGVDPLLLQQRQWELCADAMMVPAHDSPLALYDSQFADIDEGDLLQDYAVPPCFREDLLRYLGDEDRPPFRWILMGSSRSGTGMHVDPLRTDAWLILTQGLKRWALFPPETAWESIGLEPKAPQLEAVHWFQYFVANRQTMPPVVEILQRPGECVYVPAGWLHCVLNLEPSVAITHNYLPEPSVDADCDPQDSLRSRVQQTWRVMHAEEQNLVRRFREAIARERPDLLCSLEQDDASKEKFRA